MEKTTNSPGSYQVRKRETTMSKPSNKKKMPNITSNGRQHFRHLFSQPRFAACKCLSLLTRTCPSPSSRARVLRSRPLIERPSMYLARIMRARSCTDSRSWLTSKCSFWKCMTRVNKYKKSSHGKTV